MVQNNPSKFFFGKPSLPVIVLNSVLVMLASFALPSINIIQTITFSEFYSSTAFVLCYFYFWRQLKQMSYISQNVNEPVPPQYDALFQTLSKMAIRKYVQVTTSVSQIMGNSTLSLAAMTHRVDQLKTNTQRISGQSEPVDKEAVNFAGFTIFFTADMNAYPLPFSRLSNLS